MRVRPLNSAEQARGEAAVVSVHPDDCHKVHMTLPGQNGLQTARSFGFHACLGPDATQEDVIKMCGIPQLLDAALDGYNATILAVRPCVGGMPSLAANKYPPQFMRSPPSLFPAVWSNRQRQDLHHQRRRRGRQQPSCGCHCCCVV